MIHVFKARENTSKRIKTYERIHNFSIIPLPVPTSLSSRCSSFPAESCLSKDSCDWLLYYFSDKRIIFIGYFIHCSCCCGDWLHQTSKWFPEAFCNLVAKSSCCYFRILAVMFSRQSSRPYTVGSFQAKLALFEQFIQEFTYVDEELNPEERQQILQARLTNGKFV